jgi:hypothetical protein
MIRNRPGKMTQLTHIIENNIAQINAVYGGGPSLYFYRRIGELRAQHPCVSSFLSCGTCMETLYATLVSWNMNSRAAKMKDYPDFKGNLQASMVAFQAVEAASAEFAWGAPNAVIEALSDLYDMLALMRTGGRLVSNSKCLHFVFPSLCPPMDRTNTLLKLYGDTSESRDKFLEVVSFACEILAAVQEPRQYLDNQWNTCEMKLVDNAIVLLPTERAR